MNKPPPPLHKRNPLQLPSNHYIFSSPHIDKRAEIPQCRKIEIKWLIKVATNEDMPRHEVTRSTLAVETMRHIWWCTLNLYHIESAVVCGELRGKESWNKSEVNLSSCVVGSVLATVHLCVRASVVGVNVLYNNREDALSNAVNCVLLRGIQRLVNLECESIFMCATSCCVCVFVRFHLSVRYFAAVFRVGFQPSWPCVLKSSVVSFLKQHQCLSCSLCKRPTWCVYSGMF